MPLAKEEVRFWMGGDHDFRSAEPEGPAEPSHEPVRTYIVDAPPTGALSLEVARV